MAGYNAWTVPEIFSELTYKSKRIRTMSRKIVVASGYFDPLHFGHIEYLSQAKQLGDQLIVIVNNDRQAQLKKGFSFMPADQRIRLIRELRCVDHALIAVDEDRTVRKTLELLQPAIFANGGDADNHNIPEADVCERLGIEMIDGLGNKINSSRTILGAMQQKLDSAQEGYLQDKH